MSYAPIHNHSEFSSLDGVSKVIEIVERCKCIGCTAAGITDHGTVAGHLEFGKVMAQHGLKPVFGCELYHGVKTTFAKQERDASHFVTGALTDEGLLNLWRMVDAASRPENFRFVGRVNWDIIKQFSQGVFATSACIQGVVARGVLGKGEMDPYEALNRYLDAYGDNFFIEIHTYPGEEHELLNHELVRIAQERGVGLIYATDAHFAGPEQYKYHDAYVAMKTGDNVFMDPEDRKMWHPKSLYIQDEAQIRESLSYLPEWAVDEALGNSGDLADRCDAHLPGIRRHLAPFIPSECPWLPKKESRSTSQVFVDLVEEGLVNRYGNDAPDEVWDRAAYEMEVFLGANVGQEDNPLLVGGLAHYFLQAWDFCAWCDDKGIRRGPGRGSAAGAIVAYALGITDVDPLRYGLIFERFYNPGREKGFPDIDNDFPVRHRKRVREYLMDRWGHDKVRTIGTITRLKPLAAIEKTYKCYGIDWSEMDAIKKIVHSTPDIDILDSDAVGWDDHYEPGKTVYVKKHVGDKIEAYIAEQSSDRIPLLYEWLEFVEFICSRISGYGVHPSGVVVSDTSLDAELPCVWNNKQELQVTCFPMADVDVRGFVKQDFLGLKNLDILEEWEKIVGEVNWSGMESQEWPDEMWQLLDDGFTLSIFQIEDGYGRQLCKQMHPRDVRDLSIIVALNRPGPIRTGAPKAFIARRQGEEDVTFDHPILEDLLQDTYGLFVYQEQVIFYFEKLGYSKSDADAVRKILGKKKPAAWLALFRGEGEWEGKGYMQMAATAGLGDLSDTQAATWNGGDVDPDPFPNVHDPAWVIWRKIVDFAKYSFNMSHGLCYGTLGFRGTWAKWMDLRALYIAAIRVLSQSNDSKRAQKIGALIGEARRKEIRVLPPDIMRSRADIGVVDDDILFGLSNIKYVRGAAKHIVALRERYDISTPERMEEAINQECALWEERKEAARNDMRPFKERSMRQLIPANRIAYLHDAGAFDMYLDRHLKLSKVQNQQSELLGVILTDDCDNILLQNRDIIDECDDYAMLDLIEDGERVNVPGVVVGVNPRKTKREGKSMGVITIEYGGDEIEFVVFPRQWADYKYLWKERTTAIFTLKRTERGVHLDYADKLT